MAFKVPPIGQMLPPPPLVFPSEYKTVAPKGSIFPTDIKPYLWGALGVFVLGIVVRKVF